MAEWFFRSTEVLGAPALSLGQRTGKYRKTMSTVSVAFIHQQRTEFQRTLAQSPDDAGAFANYVLCKQHESTAQQIRELVLRRPTEELRDALALYADTIEQSKIPNELILEKTVLEDRQQRVKRVSVDVNAGIEAIDTELGSTALDDDDDDENLSQLRQRLTEGRSQLTKVLSMDEQLGQEEAKQDDILKDMLQFVQGIKEGANAFNHKLNEENDILKAAEAGLQVTQKKINKSTKKLVKTINELSLFTALKMFGVLVATFLLSLLVISILPKL